MGWTIIKHALFRRLARGVFVTILSSVQRGLVDLLSQPHAIRFQQVRRVGVQQPLKRWGQRGAAGRARGTHRHPARTLELHTQLRELIPEVQIRDVWRRHRPVT